MFDLKSVLASAGVELSEVEEAIECEALENKHRGKAVIERPKEEFKLKSISKEPFIKKKTQKDPTSDLIELSIGLKEFDSLPLAKYIVICKDTTQAWLCPTKECLDANFIYREDLDIFEVNSVGDIIECYCNAGYNVMNPGILTRKTCYILDNPGAEVYEVYYDSNFPAQKYGKATPNGMFIHKYENRFHRDMAIMELDTIYDEASKKRAEEMTKKEMKSNEAIIISDGCWMREVCASSCWYLDAGQTMHLTSGHLPSEPDQAVLISEITGATLALQLCILNKKKRITYYYDNTSILNVLRNRKTEYIKEIQEYKELLEDMDSKGYKVNFVELHPKTGEGRDKENRALMYFHNDCDRSCREMTDIFRKDYKSYACGGSTDGKSYQQVKEEFKLKGKPNNGYKKPGNSFNPRKH